MSSGFWGRLLANRVQTGIVKEGPDGFSRTLVEEPPLGCFIRVQPWMWFCSELCLLVRGVRTGLQVNYWQSTYVLHELPYKIQLYHRCHRSGRSKQPWCDCQSSAKRTAGVPVIQR